MIAFPLVAIAELLVVFIGFGVWAHHMFATGIPTTTLVFFAGASVDGGDPVDDPGVRVVVDASSPAVRSSGRRCSSSSASSSSS